MSPPMERPRSFTRPPMPPDDIDTRVRDLEHTTEGHGAKLDGLLDELQRLNTSVTDIKTTITVWTSQRETETKNSDRWKNWVLGLLGTLVAAAFIWIATVLHAVQSSKIVP